MASLLVGAIADLFRSSPSAVLFPLRFIPHIHLLSLPIRSAAASPVQFEVVRAYLRHSSLALEPPPHTVVDTLGLPPARVDALEAVALVAVEALRVCIPISISNCPYDVQRSAKFSRADEEDDRTATERIGMWCGCGCGFWMGGIDVRFLTIGTCFLAATICAELLVGRGHGGRCSRHSIRTLSAGVVEWLVRRRRCPGRKVWSCEIDVGAVRQNWFRRPPTSERDLGDVAKPH